MAAIILNTHLAGSRGGKTSVYRITHVDRNSLYLTNIHDATDRPEISARAYNRTFHECHWDANRAVPAWDCPNWRIWIEVPQEPTVDFSKLPVPDNYRPERL